MHTFRAEKAISGYAIIPSNPLDKPAAYDFEVFSGLVVHPKDSTAGFTKYTPSDTEDLFLEFLRTETDGPSLLAFANKYGLLGLDPTRDGELLVQWTEQIQAVGRAFWLWEIHEDHMPWDQARLFVDDVPQVVSLASETWVEVPVKTTPEGKPYLDLERPERHESPRETHGPSLRARLDPMEPAQRMSVLRPWLRQQIAETVGPNLYKYCGHGFAFSSTGDRAWMTQQPRSLLGVIWLQLAWHLTGKCQWRECALDGCHKWFPVSNEKTGPRKQYCKDAHRVAACKRRPDKFKNPTLQRRARQRAYARWENENWGRS